MSWPYILGGIVALGAGWLLLRPALSALMAGWSPKQRGLANAGLLALAGVLLFAVRLAPFGVMAFVLAGGTLARTLTQGRTPEGLSDEPVGPRARMSEAEALSILGLAPGADAVAVTAAHKRMIVRAHPDRGGSDYMAAKVNEARAVLRKEGG